MSFLLFLVTTAIWELEASQATYTGPDSRPERSSETQTSIGSLSQRDWELVSSISQTVRPENSFLLSPLRRVEGGPPTPVSSHLNVIMRLQKLEYYFTALKVFEDDCKRRLLCEIAKDPAKFSPLSSAFLDETRYNGEEKVLAERLLTSNEGAQLLSYIETVQRGHDRQNCDIWIYRCPKETEAMINYESLLVWREISKWLTIKMVSRRQ